MADPRPPTTDHGLSPLRVVVVGTSGCGKTTLAVALSQRLGVPHVELDALHWGPDWTETPTAVFREQVEATLCGDRWVVDGNYTHKVRDLVWERADTLIWLDYPLPLAWVRVVRRTFRRIFTREELWNGNRERIRDLFSREALWFWVLTTHHRRRRRFAEFLAEPESGHLTVLRFRSSGETRQWLTKLP
jgi:adenylate kinase family enzyme